MVSPELGRQPSEAFRAQIEHMACPDRLNVAEVYQRAYYQALEGVLGNSDFPVVNQLFAEQETLYPERRLKDQAENFQRHDNNYNLRVSTPGWPRGHHLPQAKLEAFQALETDSTEQALFRRNIKRGRQTNVPDRGVLFKAAELMLEHEGPIKMFDMGISRHHISKKLASEANQPFAEFRSVDVMDAIGDSEPNPAASWRFNQMVNNTSLPIASSIGIDIQDMIVGETRRDHDEMREWARSCFYTSEYLYDRDRLREFDHWEETSLRQVQFFQGDVTDLDHDRFRHHFPCAEDYDVAYFSTVGYLLGKDGMQAAIDNVRPYLRKNGRILLQDFVQVGEDKSLNFLTEWPEWSYALYSLDLAREEDGFTKLFTVASGRIGKIALEPAMANTEIARKLRLNNSED